MTKSDISKQSMNHNFWTNEVMLERLDDWVRVFYLTNNHERNKQINDIIMNWWYDRVYLTEAIFPTFFNWISFKRESLYILKWIL